MMRELETRPARSDSAGRGLVRLLPLGLALVLTGLVAGCASNNPTPTFDLTAPSGFSAAGSGGGQLIVVAPTALAALNTQRILVEPAPGQITYLPDAQWADNLPALLHARTLQAFENGSKLRRVARPGDGVAGDRQLNLDIRTFGVQVEGGGAQAVVSLSAKIIDLASGRIVAAQVFSARTPISNVNGAEVTNALDQASGQVLVQLVRWASPRF